MITRKELQEEKEVLFNKWFDENVDLFLIECFIERSNRELLSYYDYSCNKEHGELIYKKLKEIYKDFDISYHPSQEKYIADYIRFSWD